MHQARKCDRWTAIHTDIQQSGRRRDEQTGIQDMTGEDMTGRDSTDQKQTGTGYDRTATQFSSPYSYSYFSHLQIDVSPAALSNNFVTADSAIRIGRMGAGECDQLSPCRSGATVSVLEEEVVLVVEAQNFEVGCRGRARVVHLECLSFPQYELLPAVQAHTRYIPIIFAVPLREADYYLVVLRGQD